MIGRPDVHALGPGSVAAGRIEGGVTTYVDVFGSVSIPLEVARLDPARVFADADVAGFVGREWLRDHCALIAMVPHPPNGQRADALDRTLRSAIALDDHYARVSARGRKLSEPLTTQPGLALLRLALRQVYRSGCLMVWTEAADALAAELGGPALGESLDAVGDTCTWWP